MTGIVVAPMEFLPVAELGSASNQQLREELARSLTFSAHHLAYLAAVWAELERRGEDLSDLRTGLAVYLPQIAAGRLDAEAVIRFAGQPTVLRSISGLSPDRQRALAKGEPVKVLTVDESGRFEESSIPAYALTASQARMVFDGDKILNGDEQRAILESRRVSKAVRVRPGSQNRVRYDAKADVLRIGRSSATTGEVSAALAEAGQSRQNSVIDTPADTPVMIRLTESEHRMLKVRAAEAGMTILEYTRAVLKKACVL
ncbi:MAG: hypothetical protein ACK5JE_13320 [Castellaniella sp.]|uniref:hypothetical protein n=1 Tax=Castellaniella sp. TaxID=1955812 RepID=UPI003A8A2BC4